MGDDRSKSNWKESMPPMPNIQIVERKEAKNNYSEYFDIRLYAFERSLCNTTEEKIIRKIIHVNSEVLLHRGIYEIENDLKDLKLTQPRLRRGISTYVKERKINILVICKRNSSMKDVELSKEKSQ